MIRRLASLLAVLVAVGTVLVAVGVGQGSPPRNYTVSPAARAHEVAAIARSTNPAVRRGEELFGAHGCNACHTLAAGGFAGRLGPRLDAQTLGTNAAVIESFIKSPPHELAGFQKDLMPRNFASRLSERDIHDLAAFVSAAAQAAH